MFNHPRTTHEGRQQNRSPKNLSIVLLVFTALLAGFVTPLVSTAPAQAATTTPVTQTVYVVYASRDYIPDTEAGKNSFLKKQYLDALIKEVSTYWNNETKGALSQYKYDWNEVKTLQVPPEYPMWVTTVEAADYYGLSTALFPGVRLYQNNAIQVLTLVRARETADPASPPTMSDGHSTSPGTAPSLLGSGAVRMRFNEPEGPSVEPARWSANHRWTLAHELGHNLGLAHAYQSTCQGNEYDFNSTTDNCTIAGDFSDIMSPTGFGNDSGMLSIPHLTAFERAQIGLLDNGGRQVISDGFSRVIPLINREKMDFTSINEVRITDPSNSRAVYSIENLAGTVQVRRLRPLASGIGVSNEPVRIWPTRTSGASDSFTSDSGFITFTVFLDGDTALLLLNVTPMVGVSVTSITASPGGNISSRVNVTSGTSWEVTAPEWIRVPRQGTGNQYVSVGFAPNLTGQPRSGTITVTAGDVSKTITVTQDPVVLTVSQSEWTISDRGGTLPVTITANADWRVSISSGATTWLTTDKASRLSLQTMESQTMNVTAMVNSTGDVRSGVVTIAQASSGLSRTITVTQLPSDCGATTSSYCTWPDVTKSVSGMIDSSGDKDWYRFVAPSSGPWTFASSVPASGGLGDPYGTLYSSTGAVISSNDDDAGNRQFLVQASLVQGQTYFLEVKGFNSSYTGMFTVTAAKVAPVLNVRPESLSVSTAAGSLSLPVGSNTSWAVGVTQGSNWVSVTPTTGSGAGSVSIAYQANTGEGRTAVLTFVTTAGVPQVSTTMSLTQVAADCAATTSTNCSWSNLAQPISGAIDPTGDKDWYRFIAPSSGTWTFTSSIPSSGGLFDAVGTVYASNGTTVVASNDDGAGNRQFKITASLTIGQTYYLEVRGYGSYTGAFTVTAAQLPPSLTVSPGSLSFAAAGGSSAVTVTSDTSWSVSLSSQDASWLSVTPASGSGNGPVIVQARANAGAARSGVVTFTSTTGEPPISRQVTVTQPGSDCGASTSSYCSWLNVTTPVSGVIDPGGDKDWYRFTVPSSGTWAFTSSIPSSGGLYDPYGTIYASNGTTMVASNDDGAGNRQFKITASLTTGQTYYLEVKGYASTYTGAFTVTAAKIS